MFTLPHTSALLWFQFSKWLKYCYVEVYTEHPLHIYVYCIKCDSGTLTSVYIIM